MRHVALSLLVATAMMMSGCVEFFTPQADVQDAETDETDGDVSQDGDAGDTGTGKGTGGSSGSSGGSGGTEPTGEPEPGENATEEPSEPEAAPPNEQLQESPEEIDRPGEYALLPKGSANSDSKTSVPTWAPGATWSYRVKTVFAPDKPCTYDERVNGTGTVFDVPVYLVDTTTRNDNCRGQDKTNEPVWNANLMKIGDDGYVEHELVFDLEDGKRWVFKNSANTTMEATMDFVPRYLWNLKSVSAWHITIEHPDDTLRYELWYGIDAKNFLRKEVWIPQVNAAAPTVETDLLSYSH